MSSNVIHSLYSLHIHFSDTCLVLIFLHLEWFALFICLQMAAEPNGRPQTTLDIST